MSHLMLLFAVYLGAIFLIISLGIYHHRRFDKALWIFFSLIVLIFLNEVTAYILVFLKTSRTMLSHVFSVLELSLVCAYFIWCLNLPAKKASLLFCIAMAVAIGSANIYFFQKTNIYNSYMLVVESFLIIAMSLYMLYRFFKNDMLVNIYRNMHFRIWVALLILWTGTFFYWGFFQHFLLTKPQSFLYRLMGFQLLLNIAVYGFFAYTFFSIKKLSVMQIKEAST